MKKHDWTSVIGTNIRCLKLLGLWPEDIDGYKFNLYTVYALALPSIFCFAHTVGQTIMLFTHLNDLDVVAEIVFMCISGWLVLLKMFYFARNITVFKKLIVTLNSELFQPRSDEQISLVDPALKVWQAIYKMLYGAAIVDVTLWSIGPLLDGTFKEYRLPLLEWYPYDYKNTPLYEINYLHQVISFVTLTNVDVNLDSLIAALCMYAATQLDLLCDNLRTMRQEYFAKELVKCVEHHREIVSFVENFNTAFDWILFVQFFASALSLGLTMFYLTIVIYKVEPSSSNFYPFLFYAAALILEIFIFCWFGNEVQIKSEKVSSAAFESSWIGTSLSEQKNLMFFIMRTQRILKISALNLFDLSLDTFLKILKTAYSYFALMNQQNN